jgi:DNA repair exonuclease SbcCD ATPase subunit
MKASLILNDIGGFKGQKKFVFESSSLNIVEAPNSGGKSSLVKGIVGVLSVPHDGKFDPYLLKEAKYLGVKSDDLNTQEGFVNIHSEYGEVILDIDDIKDIYKVKQNGTYLELPKHSDQRFLLSGILSNDTKILRQLRHTDEDNEPDDFKWAVTRLSNAKNYDEIVDFLKREKEDAFKKENEAKNAIARTKNLREEIIQHQKDLEQLKIDLSLLESKFKGKAKPITKRKTLIENIEKLNEEIIQKNAELKKRSDELKIQESDLNKINKEIETLEIELENLKLFDLKVKDFNEKSLEDIKKKEISSINEEITKLKEIRGENDGVYNLYYFAQTSLRDREFTKCPLCEEGNLTFDKIENKLKELKQKKDSISNIIMEKSQNIKVIENQFANTIKQKENLSKTINEKKQAKRFPEKKMIDIKKQIEHLNEDLSIKTRSKAEAIGELEELIKLIGLEDEEINKIYTEKEQQKGILSDKITIKQNEVDSALIDFKQENLTPNLAIDVLSEYIELLDGFIGHAKEMGDKQRQAAADKFNNTIKILINELNFEEFRDIKLNKEFKLYIERFDPKSEDYVTQLVSTLSTSEKLTIALILQIALKETYIPHIPFLILDDVMEDFDENRRNKIFKYLLNKAKEENWVIILTKLIEEKKPIHVVNWTPK